MFPVGWTKYQIASDPTKVSGSSNLTDFPALISSANLSSAVYAGLNTAEVNAQGLLSDTVAYYRFESGADTTDSSSNSNNLTHVNTPTNTASGKFGYGMDYELSSSQYSYASDSASLDLSTAVSISAWVNVESITGTHTIAIKGRQDNGSVTNYAFGFDSSGYLRFYYYTGSYQIYTASSNALTTGSFHHVAVSYTYGSASSIKIYVDGVLCSGSWTTGTGTASATTNAERLQIGCIRSTTTPIEFFDGVIDDLAIFGKALNDGEIKSLYRGGSDLRITTDSAGTTEVPFEIVSLDTSAETCEIWAKVPTLSYNSATSLFIWYGNSSALPYSASDTHGSQNVWTDYQLVYHFEGSTIVDSTTNANTGTNSGTTLDTAGKIGSAREWDTAGDYITGGSGTSIDDTFASGATIMAWLNPDSDGISNTFGYIAEKKASVGWIFSVDPLSGSDLPFVFIHDFSTARGKWTSTTASLPINTWSHAVLKYDNGSTANNPTALINGSSIAFTENETPSGTRSDDSSSTLYLGQNDGGSRTWDGHIDEFRIRNGQTTGDWDLTEYNNQNSPSTFWTAVSGNRHLGLLGVGT